MARTPEAIVTPELLVWGRESIGLTVAVAAKKIGVSEERLSSWETGDARPSIAQLRKAADCYKRPLAVFYLPEPPLDFRPLTDFRRLPAPEDSRLSPELHQAIRRARFQQEALIELRELISEPMREAPRLAASPKDPDSVGSAARRLLGVSLEAQHRWETEGRALQGWMRALEDLDVLVLHAQGVSLSEMRGFSISALQAPVIALNGGDSARGRIFTALHEFAHLLLNDAGVCDLHERATRPDDDVEVFCNRAAGSALLPTAAFLSEPRVENPPANGQWPDQDLRSLSDKYSVSQEVILRRLFGLGLTSWEFLQHKRQDYARAYERQKRREAESTGGPSFYRLRVRDLGRPYTRVALEAYHRSEINASQLADYLEVKLNHLPKLEAELARAAAA
jgi:Zn-dependent peptidase ImmA (M78 family)/DNA-binding XRE family transcriptional regulator